jgi:hypothetical protein
LFSSSLTCFFAFFIVVASMGPRYDYKDMLDNVVGPIACGSMNHQNQFEQMANEVMFATTRAWTLDPLTRFPSLSPSFLFTFLHPDGEHGKVRQGCSPSPTTWELVSAAGLASGGTAAGPVSNRAWQLRVRRARMHAQARLCAAAAGPTSGAASLGA